MNDEDVREDGGEDKVKDQSACARLSLHFASF